MNNVTLIGRLTKDPEQRQSNSGTVMCNFTLAVNRRFKKQGQPDADFITCVAFGKTAEIICKYLHKGDQMGAEGSIQTSNYTNKQGQKIYRTDVLVNQMEFIGSKNQQSSGTAQQGQPKNAVQQNPYQDAAYGPEETLPEEYGDDLPF